MIFAWKDYTLELLNAPERNSAADEVLARQDIVYDASDARFRPSSFHRLACRREPDWQRIALLIAGGGASGVHARSLVVVKDTCFVAVGDHVFALALPDLDLRWSRTVDAATCFGVLYLSSHDCLISHGEMEIARLSTEGTIAWSSGGRDIFSESCEIVGDRVVAVDFNLDVYRFDIETGCL